MVDAAICDGDWVVVRQQSVADNGEIVAAMIDGEATVEDVQADPRSGLAHAAQSGVRPDPGQRRRGARQGRHRRSARSDRAEIGPATSNRGRALQTQSVRTNPLVRANSSLANQISAISVVVLAAVGCPVPAGLRVRLDGVALRCAVRVVQR